MRARFADGFEAAGDVLIGADGVHSAVRRVDRSRRPGAELRRSAQHGRLRAGVRIRRRAGPLRADLRAACVLRVRCRPAGGEVWWFANVPWKAEPSPTSSVTLRVDDWRRRLLELFADDSGPALELIGATDELMPLSPIHSIPRLPRWHRERMLVVGDAAHAPSPSSGQGASLAIEDAVVLAACLRDLPDAAAAFARFEAARATEGGADHPLGGSGPTPARRPGRSGASCAMPCSRRSCVPSARSGAHERAYGHRVDWDAVAARLLSPRRRRRGR